MASRLSSLPSSLPPVGISRVQAAEFIGVSVNYFDAMVKAGTMPAPRRAGARVIYDVAELVQAFRALPKADDEQGSGPDREAAAYEQIFGRCRT